MEKITYDQKTKMITEQPDVVVSDPANKVAKIKSENEGYQRQINGIQGLIDANLATLKGMSDAGVPDAVLNPVQPSPVVKVK